MSLEAVANRIAEGQDAFRERLFQLLRFRSVSTDPVYEPDMRAARDFLKDWLAEIGLDNRK